MRDECAPLLGLPRISLRSIRATLAADVARMERSGMRECRHESLAGTCQSRISLRSIRATLATPDHGRTTTFPATAPLSTASCAAAISDSGNVRATLWISVPPFISRMMSAIAAARSVSVNS